MAINKGVINLVLILLIVAFPMFYTTDTLAKSESAEIQVRLIVLPPLSMDINPADLEENDMVLDEKIIRETYMNVEDEYPLKEYFQGDGLLVTTSQDEDALTVKFTKTI